MAGLSAIEWTDRTWNPTTGCTKVSPACAHCYIERTFPFRKAGRRFVRGSTDLQLHPDRLEAPLHWRKPVRIFVNSMSDLFHEEVPDTFIADVWATMARSPQHTYQILTKRPARMLDWCQRGAGLMTTALMFWKTPVPPMSVPYPLPNVWLGVSAENQRMANLRIPLLLQTPAAIRFVSYEPALGPTDFEPWLHVIGAPGVCYAIDGDGWHEPGSCPYCRPRLDWIIAGGESGPKARPAHPDWFRSVRDQCQAAGVPFFFKQWGEWTPGVNVERRRGHVETVTRIDDRWLRGFEDLSRDDCHRDDEPDLYRIGKKAAGRELDGRTWDEFPPAVTA